MRLSLDRAMIRTGVWAIILAVIAMWVPMESIAHLYLRSDLPVAVAGGVTLILLGLWRAPRPVVIPQWMERRASIATIILLVGVVALAGTWLVFCNYGESRDEILADFAAVHFRAGVLMPPVPAQWHDYAEALQPNFMVGVPGNRFWLSGYLPGNSLLRAALGPATGPFLLMLASVAVYNIARRLWPDRRGLALLTLLLSASSVQLLVNAMTPYAMTAHLALNLVWLWLFLRNDRIGDTLALAIGWLACGLHQIIFHPLFVMPFIVQLWLRGARRRAVIFAAAYVAIGIFWASYWQILLDLIGDSPLAGDGGSSVGIHLMMHRVFGMLDDFNLLDIWLMVANLLRFITWQNLALVPLIILAWPAIRADDGIVRPLAAGIILLLAALFVLMPFQGIGWGYRYLNGVVGSAALLAAYGWRSIAGETDRSSTTKLCFAMAVTMMLIIPWQMAQASRFTRPYRTAYKDLIKTSAEVVLVDDGQLFFAGDLVRNRWDLSNRPLIMELAKLDEPAIRSLCARQRIALFDQRDGNRAGILSGTGPWPDRAAANHQLLERLGCAGLRPANVNLDRVPSLSATGDDTQRARSPGQSLGSPLQWPQGSRERKEETVGLYPKQGR